MEPNLWKLQGGGPGGGSREKKKKNSVLLLIFVYGPFVYSQILNTQQGAALLMIMAKMSKQCHLNFYDVLQIH